MTRVGIMVVMAMMGVVVVGVGVVGVMVVMVVVLLPLHGFLARFLRHIVFGVFGESRLHGCLVGLLAMVIVMGMVGSVVVGLMFVMPVIAHVSTSCWRESFSN
jgi:hypothetical protein